MLMSGCGASGGKAKAASAPASSTTLAGNTRSATSTQATGTTTPVTAPGEIRGTATDFCSAVTEAAKRISAAKGTPIASAYIIINEWIADLRRFAPASLRPHVEGLITQLTGVSTNLQLGLISTNENFRATIMVAINSPDGQAVGMYAHAHCPHP
jgi:hypothetical protein